MHAGGGQAVELERRRLGSRLSDRAQSHRLLGRLGRRAGDLLAEHVGDDQLLAAFLRHDRRDSASVAQDRRTVARLDHLVESVRDEEDGAPAFALVAHRDEDALGEVGWQRRGDLVEKQQPRLARERASQVDHPQGGKRQVGDERTEVDVELQRRELATYGVEVAPRHAEVRGDGQIGDERGVLEHRREPDPRRVGRRAHPDGRAIDGDRAAVGLEDARQDLDEGALARAVGAEQGVHLPRLDDEVGRAEGDHRAEALRDVSGFEERIGHSGRVECAGAARRPPRLRSRSTAPCSRRARPRSTSSTA